METIERCPKCGKAVVTMGSRARTLQCQGCVFEFPKQRPLTEAERQLGRFFA